MLQRLLDPFRGNQITIPPMDGPLLPNNLLEEAPSVLDIHAPDNVVVSQRRVLFSAGNSVLALSAPGEVPETLASFNSRVAALAISQDGGMAVGLDEGRIVVSGGRHDGAALASIGPAALACPTALTFLDAGTLIVCQGAAKLGPADWRRDLMDRGASGSVWSIDLASGNQHQLAAGLAFPYGVLAAGPWLIVSESWRHRLVRLPHDGGAVEPVLARLPAYPARLAAAAGGGAWLCLFAPRNRLIEFVLAEDEYRSEMMRSVDPDLWIAPALSSRQAPLQPLQCGEVRTMGIHKPWAPSRSYGLLVRLDGNFQPVASFHSRAGGARHGITSAVADGPRVLATAKGGGAILVLEPMAATPL